MIDPYTRHFNRGTFGLWCRRVCAVLCVVGFLVSGSTVAFGIQNWMVSGNSAGTFGAGAAAAADNPDTSYYNPAASPWIQHQDMGFSLLSQNYDAGFTGTVSGTPGQAQGARRQLTPNLFYVAPISDKWGFGFAIVSPYQYNLHYGAGAVTSPVVTDWHVNTFDITPSLAYRVVKSLSFGAGLDIERASFNFNRAGIGNTKDHNWNTGWNVGLVWQPAAATRVGADYHSAITHRSHATSSGGTPVTVHYTLPSDVTMSVYQGLGRRLALLASADYTEWSRLNNMALQGATNPQVISGLRNSWLFALGGLFRATPRLTLKTGVGYVQSSVAAGQNTLVFSDANTWALSIGTNYRLNKTVNVDLGFSHYFARTVGISTAAPVTTNGTMSLGRDIAGIQVNWVMT